MIDFDQFWEPSEEAPAGATAKQLQTATKAIGKLLPTVLAAALQKQNGGLISDEPILLYGTRGMPEIPAISPAKKAFQKETLALISAELGSPADLIVIGEEGQGHSYYALDYSVGDGEDLAEVVVIDPHCGYCERLDETCDEFLRRLMQKDAEPSVDWKESEQFDLLAEQGFQFEPEGEDVVVQVDQRLCESATAYIVFRRESDGEQSLLFRCEILKPLDPAAGMIVQSDIFPGISQLILAPEKAEEPEQPDFDPDDYDVLNIVWNESRTSIDGKWKNRSSTGHPEWVTFESPDREALQQLRTQLFGDEVNEHVEAGEALQELLATLGDDEISTVFPELLETLMQAVAQTDGSGELPPEWQQLVEQVEQLPKESEGNISSKSRQKLDDVSAKLRHLLPGLSLPDNDANA